MADPECRSRNRAPWRMQVLTKHLAESVPVASSVRALECLAYEPPEAHSELPSFDKAAMRVLLDGHDISTRDYAFNLMLTSNLFVSRSFKDQVFANPDLNVSMDEQREKTMERIHFMAQQGLFKGSFTGLSVEKSLRQIALFETMGIFDHSLVIKLGVHFHLWGNAILHLGTERHRAAWAKKSEELEVFGCFAMTELGHGSNVRGVETLTTYDSSTQEFIINTPCESAQKHWIGGAAKHSTHTIVFSQLLINGRNEGVHAFVCQIRDAQGRCCPGIRTADCGHKTGLNGVDNGRIWFDKVRIPRENLLNSVADVTPDGQYVSSIENPDQRFGVFMAPLTLGRVNIAMSAITQAKLGLATALRYSLTRRAFSQSIHQPEVLLLDYPSHQRRLLPLLAKTYAMNLAAVDLKKLHFRDPNTKDIKVVHVMSSGFKAMFTWHCMRTLQECREACGGQGLKSENRIGQLKADHDSQPTIEGDNHVLMQQVSKALLGDYFVARMKGRPMKGMGLEHLNHPPPVLPDANSSTLRDSNFQLALFRLRERRLLERLDLQVKEHISTGLSTNEALLLSYQLAEDLGKAFSERLVLESALAAEQQAEADSMKQVLGLLRTLFVLTVADEGAVFLRYGILSPEHSQLIQAEVAALCAELRPQALHLVDAFCIPPPFLGPIAFDWVDSNSWENVCSSASASSAAASSSSSVSSQSIGLLA